MNYEQARERVKLEREMDDDLEVVRRHIERAYAEDYDDAPSTSYISKEDREELFQAFLRLSRRLRALEQAKQERVKP